MRNAYSILVRPAEGTGTYRECPRHARADVNKIHLQHHGVWWFEMCLSASEYGVNGGLSSP